MKRKSQTLRMPKDCREVQKAMDRASWDAIEGYRQTGEMVPVLKDGKLKDYIGSANTWADVLASHFKSETTGEGEAAVTTYTAIPYAWGVTDIDSFESDHMHQVELSDQSKPLPVRSFQTVAFASCRPSPAFSMPSQRPTRPFVM